MNPQFDGMSLDELNATCQEMVSNGPPTDPRDSEFLIDLAREIALREKELN